MDGPVSRVDARAADAQRRRLARGAGAPWLHAEVARRMAERLAAIKVQPATIVEWGGFLGASAEPLAAAYPKARRIVVEPHAALAARSAAAGAAPWWSARRWTRPAAEAVEARALADGTGQLLWSNMSLHAEPEPAATLAEWRRLVGVGGFLMFSTLGPDTLAELRAPYAGSGWGPPAQAFVDMHDIGDALLHAGFADPVMDQEHLSLSWASPCALLDELRTLGGNLAPQRAPGLRTPRWRARLEAALAARADTDGRISMSFEIVYGHAFVAARAPRGGDGPQAIALDDLRAKLPSRRRAADTP